MTPTDFWHENIGQHICTLPSSQSSGCTLPHRTLKGTKALRIGAIDSFYIATVDQSFLIGRVELPNSDRICMIATERHSARKYLATWLIEHGKGPFMVGVISLANAAPSFRISHHETKSYFCEANAGFEFDLEKIRKALSLIKDFSWKKDIAPAIHLHSNWMHAQENERLQLQTKLKALLTKTPALRTILSVIDIRPGSGEYQILSWYNIEQKTTD